MLDVFDDVVLREIRGSSTGSPIEFTYFSDSVVFSCSRNEPRAEHLIFEKSRRLVERFLLHGLACRGGIVYGPTYHVDRIIFGKGMLDAHYLESKVANYPRIVVDESLAFEAQEKERLYDSEPSLCISDSGLYFLDIFGPIARRGPSGKQALALVGQAIGKNLHEVRVSGRPDIIAKWTWLKNQYNKAVQTMSSPDLLIPG